MSSETRIRVMIVDDHAIVREGIAELLEQSGAFEVVGQAADGEEAVEKVRDLRPDVVIMDILMPVKNGIEACRDITAELPDTRVLMLTASNDHGAIVQSVKRRGHRIPSEVFRQGDAGVNGAGGCRRGVPGAGRGGKEIGNGHGQRARSDSAQRTGPADDPGAGDTQDVRPRDVVRRDS